MPQDRDVRSGRPVIRGTRFPISRLLAELAAGYSLQEICDQYTLIEEDVKAALHEAASLLDAMS